MCWSYKSLKSHFENTIKTFFSDCNNLPSHKNLRPMLQQQDIYCQLRQFQQGNEQGGAGGSEAQQKKGSFFSFSFFFAFLKETSAKVVWSIYPVSELLASPVKNATTWQDFVFLPWDFYRRKHSGVSWNHQKMGWKSRCSLSRLKSVTFCQI